MHAEAALALGIRPQLLPGPYRRPRRTPRSAARTPSRYELDLARNRSAGCRWHKQTHRSGASATLSDPLPGHQDGARPPTTVETAPRPAYDRATVRTVSSFAAVGGPP